VVAIALSYGVLALLAGYMLEFVRTGSSGVTVEVLSNPYSPAWWNYPALIVISPGGVLALPFFATISMVIVSIGVGLGMGAGLLVAVRFFRTWKAARTGGRSATSLAGMTPAMVAVLTLGACCSTSAAAAGGIGAVAVASGTTYDQLLLNSWFLNVFQIVVLAVALLAQEMLISVYDSLLQSSPNAGPAALSGPRRSEYRGRAPVLALRAFLLIAGTLWALSLLIDVAAPATAAPGAAVVLGGLFQHVLLGVTAIAVGLTPVTLMGTPARNLPRPLVRAVRALLLAAGASVVVGVPPPLNGWGLSGFGNDLLGALGVPAGLGGAVPPGGAGLALDLGVAAVYGLVGAFVMLLALFPHSILRKLAAGPEGTTRSLEAQALAPPGAARETS